MYRYMMMTLFAVSACFWGCFFISMRGAQKGQLQPIPLQAIEQTKTLPIDLDDPSQIQTLSDNLDKKGNHR